MWYLILMVAYLKIYFMIKQEELSGKLVQWFMSWSTFCNCFHLLFGISYCYWNSLGKFTLLCLVVEKNLDTSVLLHRLKIIFPNPLSAVLKKKCSLYIYIYILHIYLNTKNHMTIKIFSFFIFSVMLKELVLLLALKHLFFFFFFKGCILACFFKNSSR